LPLEGNNLDETQGWSKKSWQAGGGVGGWWLVVGIRAMASAAQGIEAGFEDKASPRPQSSGRN